MRRTAYVKTMMEAARLPREIPELKAYFGDGYDPREEALRHVVSKARKDDSLFDGEFIDVWLVRETLEGRPKEIVDVKAEPPAQVVPVVTKPKRKKS